MLGRPGVCFTQAVIHSIHNKAGIRRDKKMCSWDRDRNGTHICGSGMGVGLSFIEAGRVRDSCLREWAGVGLNN